MSGDGAEPGNQGNLETTISHHSDEVGITEILAFVLLSSGGAAVSECTAKPINFASLEHNQCGDVLKIGHFTKEGACRHDDETDTETPDETT